MKFLCSILSFLALTSCATVDTSYKGVDAGYAVISLTMDHEDDFFGVEAHFNTFELDFANNDTTVAGYQSFYRSKDGFDMPDPDIKDKNSQTFVIVKPLQPGGYRIFSFLLKNTGNSTLSVWNKEAFSIPFEIKPNEYNYLGNYHGIATTKKALLFGEVINGGYIVVSDYKNRDIKLARIKNPLLKEGDVVTSSVLDVQSMLNPLFASERKKQNDK